MRRVLYLFAISFWVISSCKKELNLNGVFVSPNSFLSDRKYDKLRIEIQSVQNFEPSSQSINNLVSFLRTHLRKPAGIEVVTTQIASPGKASLDLDEIKQIEKANRSVTTSGKTLTAYILFVDADYASGSGSSKVLGIAYDYTSMVLFEKTIREYSGGLTQPSVTTLETTVANHEFGHVMGLVENGTPAIANHQDKPHGAHCNNSSCLMYWSAETSDIVGNLLGNNIPTLDQNCINDLKANGGM